MQTATASGLRSATFAERRYTIQCIHNATHDFAGNGLIDLVATKTPEQIHAILAAPDVNVTNQKDKEEMLPVVHHIDEHVKEMLNDC